MAINIPIISSLDSKGFDKALKQFKALQTNSQRTGFIMEKAFLPAAAALGGLAVIGVKAVKAAVEDSKAQALLAQALKNVTGATDAQIAAQEKQITTMAMATGVADDELRPALSSLVRGTQDLATANDALALALDVSAGTGKGLQEVSDALAKAYGGNYKALKQLSPELYSMIKDGASLDEVMASLSKTFGGSAATAANTAEGKFKRLGIALSEASEAIGLALLPVVEAILPYLISFGDWAQNHVGVLLAIGTAIAAAATAVVTFKTAMLIANAVTAVATALNWGLAASATAANTALTIGVGAAAIAAGLVIAGAAFVAFKNKTKSATEAVGNIGAELKGVGPDVVDVKEKFNGAGDKAKEMADRIKEASKALTDYLEVSLDSAKTQLIDAQEAFNDFATNVSDSIKEAFSFADAKDAGDETGAGFLSGLRDQVAGLIKYGNDVKELLKMGLSQNALQAVLDAGAESGAAIAAELIAGGSDAIKETNDLVAAANGAAEAVGLSAAAKWYGAGVSNAQAYLDGVQAAFDVAQAALTKKGLTLPQIKAIGANFATSVQTPTVANVTPIAAGSTEGRPGSNLTVNVNSQIATKAEVGQAVTNALRAYNRQSGPIGIDTSSR